MAWLHVLWHFLAGLAVYFGSLSRSAERDGPRVALRVLCGNAEGGGGCRLGVGGKRGKGQAWKREPFWCQHVPILLLRSCSHL